MIDQHFDDLEALTSTKQACALLGASRATCRRRPPMAGPPAPVQVAAEAVATNDASVEEVQFARMTHDALRAQVGTTGRR